LRELCNICLAMNRVRLPLSQPSKYISSLFREIESVMANKLNS
jgi:hypothetical protein